MARILFLILSKPLQMDAKFSPKVKDVIAFSREEAVRLGHDYIDACHLLLGLIREGDGQAIKTLRNLGVPLDKLKAAVEDSMRNSVEKSGLQADQIPLTKQAEKILKITFLEAKIFKSELIGTVHLLLSILREEDCLANRVLEKFDVTYDLVKEEIDAMIEGRERSEPPPTTRASYEDAYGEDEKRQPVTFPVSRPIPKARHLSWIILGGIYRNWPKKAVWTPSLEEMLKLRGFLRFSVAAKKTTPS